MADAATRTKHERDYLERTIATVRNHQGADNCWPQWANIFADEIERLWDEVERYEQVRQEDAERVDELVLMRDAIWQWYVARGDAALGGSPADVELLAHAEGRLKAFARRMT